MCPCALSQTWHGYPRTVAPGALPEQQNHKRLSPNCLNDSSDPTPCSCEPGRNWRHGRGLGGSLSSIIGPVANLQHWTSAVCRLDSGQGCQKADWSKKPGQAGRVEGPQQSSSCGRAGLKRWLHSKRASGDQRKVVGCEHLVVSFQSKCITNSVTQ